MIIIELIFNLAVLISVSVLSGFVDNRWNREAVAGKVIQGVLFGLVALVGMLNPFVLAPGIIFDGRSVVLSLCGLFFGSVAGSIAALIAIVYRVYLGGGGVYMGISVIIFSTLTGIVFHRSTSTAKHLTNPLFLYYFGLIVHAGMMVLAMSIPAGMRMNAYKTITLTVMGIYPIATALIGKILKDQADVTGRRKAEKALLESESKFVLFMDHLPVYTFIKDSDCRCIYVSRNMDEVFGASSWLGRTPDEVFTDESGIRLTRDDLEALREGYAVVEETLSDRNGVRRLYETRKFIIPREGDLPLLGGISIDITERKNTEEQLRLKARELERFNSLMIGREIRMIELKKEINELLAQTGLEARYIIHEVPVSQLKQ